MTRSSYSVAYQHVGNRAAKLQWSQIDPQFAAFYPFGEFEFAVTTMADRHVRCARKLETGPSQPRDRWFRVRARIDLPIVDSFIQRSQQHNRSQRTIAFFAQDQIFLLNDRLQISLGARGQWFSVRAADRPGFLASVDPESSITGDGAIAYFIRSTNTKLRAHVGNGFRAPSLFERFGQGTFASRLSRFGDPTLRAEQSISVDAGFDQRLSNDRRGSAPPISTHTCSASLPSIVLRCRSAGLGAIQRLRKSSGRDFAWGGDLCRGCAMARRGLARVIHLHQQRSICAGRGLQSEYVIPRQMFGFTVNQRYRAFLFSFDLNHVGDHIPPVFENNLPFRRLNSRSRAIQRRISLPAMNTGSPSA